MFMKFTIGKYVVYSGEQFYPIIKNLSGTKLIQWRLNHQI